MVNPGSVMYKNAQITDIYKPFSYTIGHEFKVETCKDLQESLILILIQTGKKTIVFDNCFIWTKVISDHWCMYALNKTENSIQFKIKIIKSINLKCKEGANWQFILKTGAGFLKRVQSIYSYNISHCVWAGEYEQNSFINDMLFIH